MGLFDGMAGLVADVFGDAVSYTPGAGATRIVQSIGRRTPVQAIGPDGVETLLTSPTWRVRQDLVPEIARGDRVAFGGHLYRVLNAHPQGSPAVDAHLVCELDEVEA
ncbi:head-tail joining protein [Roseicitreum antarcticum]|uniref:Phage head-tail joining protein n=1 Tax=Roseicitreum antarcticum TaxID=564137 RepID=A0A1H3ETW4_9RHOB|nr:hypothetical protein [Roseicitreum antarcticum]SDX81374.1 hypothetical protein SAMN04488238_12513 [Roseicitreum antarcticum]